MNTKQDDEILKLSAKDRYQYCINKIAETGGLWTLIDTNGHFALFEVEHITVMSFWPEEHCIESNLTVDWQDYIPFKLDMDALEETVIPFLRQNKYALNVFPVDAKIGYIASLYDFVTDLNSHLESL